MTREEILEIFDLSDGVLYRKTPRKGAPAGAVTGKNRYGYIRVKVNRKAHLVHRLIWTVLRGPIPNGLFIDHINGVRDDNRIENLRLVSHRENQFNRRKHKKTKFEFKGVRAHGIRFQAVVITGRRPVYAGTYDTQEEAALAYNKKAAELFGEHACLNEVHIG